MAKVKYTPAELDARLKFTLGIILGSILFFTAMGILYALIFVTQPVGGQSENDKMFFNVLGSVATFITGTLAGLLIGKSGSDAIAETVQPLAVDESSEVEDAPEEEPIASGKPEGEMPEEQDIDEEWDKD
jgi:hypothetical protein